MEKERDMVKIIREYGGSDISLCIEGKLFSRYFIPCEISSIPYFKGKSIKDIGKMMQESRVNSLSFMKKVRHHSGETDIYITEILENGNGICNIQGSSIDRIRERRPEDYLRISEILNPDSQLPSIYW